MEYKYYFGTYPSSFNLSSVSKEDTASGAVYSSSIVSLKPWELKHVTTFTESTTAMQSTIGIPNKPSECTYIYDTQGPVRTFTLEGVRYDAEEEVSNLDFIHTQFCDYDITVPGAYEPYTGRTIYENERVFSIGIEWLLSIMQSLIKGYVVQKVATEGVGISDRTPVGDSGHESFNVGLTSFQYSMSADEPGVIKYAMTMTERNGYENGILYKKYTPSCRPVEAPEWDVNYIYSVGDYCRCGGNIFKSTESNNVGVMPDPEVSSNGWVIVETVDTF